MPAATTPAYAELDGDVKRRIEVEVGDAAASNNTAARSSGRLSGAPAEVYIPRAFTRAGNRVKFRGARTCSAAYAKLIGEMRYAT